MEANHTELVLTQAWTALRRHSLVALGAVANIAVSLAILGAFLLMAANIEHMAGNLARQATISVELMDKADGEAITDQFTADPRVKQATFVSKEQSLEEYAKRVNIPYRDLKSAIANPLPDMVRVTVNEPDDLRAVVQSAKGIKGVAKVRYQRDVAEKLFRLANGVKMLGLVLGAVMALAALMLVSTTIQLGVHSRRREIRIMQLVGATNNFIRAPFIIEGAVEGLLGGVLAAVLLLLGYSYLVQQITASLTFIDMIYGARFLTLSALGLVLCGMLFGVIGSLLGTRHYLRLI
ncbi:permease-like cell division protein FtsX [bacterium]|nr:permease-like cell division protein FtsX [bacterium]